MIKGINIQIENDLFLNVDDQNITYRFFQISGFKIKIKNYKKEKFNLKI